MEQFTIAIPDPLPLVLTHAWPSSFVELEPIVERLADPASHGGAARDAFHVVVPSMPRFGFSDRPRRRGFVAVDALWRRLMTEVLGYARFVWDREQGAYARASGGSAPEAA